MGAFKRLREQDHHFRRQRPFRGYYLDFVCLERGVVVEVDGGHHGEGPQPLHDETRDAVLARHGLRVLRFWNSDVRFRIGVVMDTIIEALESAPKRIATGQRSARS